MAFLHSSPLMLEKRLIPSPPFPSSSNKANKKRAANARVQACFNPFEDQPILKDALKEPVAFMGGMFAGLLRLDLNEDPLKEWIAKTVEAAGVVAEGAGSAEESGVDRADDAPQQIEIE